MRELKFRVWDKENREFVKPLNESFAAITNFSMGIITPLFLQIHDYPKLGKFFTQGKLDSNKFAIQQFTGLKDKKGKEIFEGDILKTKKCPAVLVSWEYCGFFPFIETQDYLYDGWAQEPEIIGNIFENPELLK